MIWESVRGKFAIFLSCKCQLENLWSWPCTPFPWLSGSLFGAWWFNLWKWGNFMSWRGSRPNQNSFRFEWIRLWKGKGCIFLVRSRWNPMISDFLSQFLGYKSKKLDRCGYVWKAWRGNRPFLCFCVFGGQGHRFYWRQSWGLVPWFSFKQKMTLLKNIIINFIFFHSSFFLYRFDWVSQFYSSIKLFIHCL